jgi:hypothetical protein
MTQAIDGVVSTDTQGKAIEWRVEQVDSSGTITLFVTCQPSNIKVDFISATDSTHADVNVVLPTTAPNIRNGWAPSVRSSADCPRS